MARVQHHDHILIYCTAGGGTLTVEGETTAVSSGDIIYLPHGSTHQYQANSVDPWSLYWLHFDGHLAEAFGEHINLPLHRFAIGLQARVVRVFDGVVALRHSSHNIAEFIQGGHQVQALLSYIALLVQQRQPYAVNCFDTEHIRAMMQEHIHAKLDLDMLANEARLSKFHFSKKFKQATGESPIKFFINMKMQRACYLLDSTARPIKHIAAGLGYQDAYYFSRLFKKTIGVSPEGYRQAKQ
ncbi:HTH-type transcriptional activator RhaR [Sinobacterium norvegicum]|uniref:HTH-type transcriptional activator RhaR n=2 Tax=Sinobacterium norvegicum TaxID=1641715 RepID=A0ABM9AGW9_9GAMM|nr:HTH-type transcriptional activator RhaR [Sinobacterium norvegicum]